MCGLVACLNASLSTGVLRSRTARALASIRERGPDESRVWLSGDVRSDVRSDVCSDAGSRARSDERSTASSNARSDVANIALGHNRLSLVDLRSGLHPVQNEDRAVTAVVNGEFYGHEELRGKLEASGHRFRTQTDSEILVHLYEEHGTECLRFLRGEFAFVLWDRRQKRLFAARDRFGVKPLVYAKTTSGDLWLASKAKALFAAGIPAAWDWDCFSQVACHQYPTPDRTMFSGVMNLPPGHFITASAGVRQTHCYWDLDHPTAAGYRTSETNAQGNARLIREQLEEAVRIRLRGDVPVAFYLSGGLDSSAVLSLAARHTARPLHAFGIAFDDPHYDEHHQAEGYAHELGAEFTIVPVGQRDLLEQLPAAVFQSEGLCINGQLVAKYMLSHAVRSAGFKAVMVGEGADENFYGYAHLEQDQLLAAGSGAFSPADLTRLQSRYPLQSGLMMPVRPAESTNPEGFLGSTFLTAKLGIGARLRPLLASGFRERLSNHPGQDLRQFFRNGLEGRHPVAQSAYLWTKTALASYILGTLGDGTEMAHSVEGRVPFLDHHLFEIARQISPDEHLTGGAKSLLREALRGVVPERIRTRDKRPLLAPPLDLADPQSKAQVWDTLASRDLESIPFFDGASVKRWLETRDTDDIPARRIDEPVFMLLLSAVEMQRQFRLGS